MNTEFMNEEIKKWRSILGCACVKFVCDMKRDTKWKLNFLSFKFLSFVPVEEI